MTDIDMHRAMKAAGKLAGQVLAESLAKALDTERVVRLEADNAQLLAYIQRLEAENAQLRVAYIKRTQLALGAGLVRFVIADKV